MKIANVMSIVAFLTGLAVGPGAAAQQWVELSTENSPLVFQPGGEASVNGRHFTVQGGLPRNNGPSYYGVFVVEPEFSELTIYLDRLGPVPSGVTRSLTRAPITRSATSPVAPLFPWTRTRSATNGGRRRTTGCRAFSVPNKKAR